jgi:endonuclease YncB( thermonuclease family)
MIRFLMFAAVLLVTSPATAQERISGIGRAADGDTLTVGADRVRLFGIDAPELHQTCDRSGQAWQCGQEAAERLAGLVNGRQVVCSTTGTDDYGRLLARCSANGVDLNREMVASGHAVAFRRYSLDYVAFEGSAKAAGRGLWGGTFQMPSEYRQAHRSSSRSSAEGARQEPSARARRSPSSSTASGISGCSIKGNRNRRGQWIYHVPGMPYYEQTRAEEIFCTEAEAQAAGYRRAVVR